MNQNDGQRSSAVRLPMAVTQNPHPRLNIDAAFFSLGQTETPLQKKAGNGLNVSPAQMAAGDESIGLRFPHQLILMERKSAISRRSGSVPIFEYICRDCDHSFEALVYGKQTAACPKCENKKPGDAAFGVCGVVERFD